MRANDRKVDRFGPDEWRPVITENRCVLFAARTNRMQAVRTFNFLFRGRHAWKHLLPADVEKRRGIFPGDGPEGHAINGFGRLLTRRGIDDMNNGLFGATLRDAGDDIAAIP